MSTIQSPRLDSEQLRALRYTVFRERTQTLDQAAAPWSVPELQAYHERLRQEIKAAVESAPDAAFERQPDDVDGGDVWSAGQVVSHLCDTHVRSQRFWEDMFGQELQEPPAVVLDSHGAQLLSRDQSLAALDGLNGAWNELMGMLPEDVDLELRGNHTAFGQAGPKGALLIFAVHSDDHLHQLLDLQAQ